MSPLQKRKYHHGNLRQALLSAASHTLEQEGLDSLSLRGLAKQAGVSPTAVYSHFSDKTALMLEIKTEGIKRLTTHLQDALTGLVDSTPEERVYCIGRSYIQFALDNQFLFDIISGWLPPLERLTPEYLDASTGCEGLMRDNLSAFLRKHDLEPDDIQSCLASLSAWSLVLGVSMLLRSGGVDGVVHCKKWPPDFSSANPQRRAQILEVLFAIQLEGFKATLGKIR